MHERLRQLLQESLPWQIGASIMVDDEALERDGSEGFMHSLRRQLVDRLSDFIVGNKVLDGTDPSGFHMQPDEKLAATRCEIRLFVLTPKELETLAKDAFNAGARAEANAMPRYEASFDGIMREQWSSKPGNQGKVPPWLDKKRKA
jgi:regulator of protease activity HflC (stomatin/prohibitin superfamily)